MINLHIKYFEINEEFNDNSNLLLIINNKKIFYLFLNDLYSNGNYLQYFELFDENNKKIKTVDVIDFIPSVLSIDVNQKKNVNALIRNIKHNYIDDIQSQVKIIRTKIDEVFQYLKIDVNVDIGSDVDFDEDDLIKTMNIYILNDKESLLERLFDYVKVSFELRNIRCFIFYNLYSFLEVEELEIFLLNCKYLGIKIINIEGNNENYCSFDKKYILDNDLCVLK